MIAKSIIFSVSKCIDNCASDSEIKEFLKDVTVDFWTIQQKMDVSNYDGNPSYKVMDLLGQHVLSSKDSIPRETITLQRVEYETYDHYMDFGGPTTKGNFFQVRKMVNRPMNVIENNSMLFETQIFLMPYKIEFMRRRYGIQNLMSEVGGFMKALMSICFYLSFPIT